MNIETAQQISLAIATLISIAMFGLSIWQIVLERKIVRTQNVQIIELLTQIRDQK